MHIRWNKKTIISLVLCIGVLFMAVGYSVLSSNLSITGGASITTTWDVRITGITHSATGNAYNVDSYTYTNDTAKFKVALIEPGDSMTYTITIQNKGTLAAILNTLDITQSGTSQIIYEVTGIKQGDTLAAGASKTVTVVARYNSNATEAPDDAVKSLSVGLNWIQYANQSISAGTYTINYNANGGSGSMSGTTCTVGSNCTLRSNSFSKSGYVFKGWSTESIGAHVYTNGQTVRNLTSSGKTITLYAVWEKEEPKLLVETILKDNTAYADNVSSPYVTASTGIDFTKISSNTNGKGLYYTSTNTEGNLPTYYFRGAVENNYVKFGKNSSGNDLYWKIIRINEDGSIRLIYNGTSTTATGSNVTIGNSEFNNDYDDNADVGYMYGITSADSLNYPVCLVYNGAINGYDDWSIYELEVEDTLSCDAYGGTRVTSEYEATHANLANSTIKEYLDTWYEANLKTNYSSYLADAGFCNDRSVAPSAGLWHSSDTALGYAGNYTVYGALGRLVNSNDLNWIVKENAQPQFACPNASNDLFTTAMSSKGNKALTNPIGLLTADEVWYAGATTAYNETYYLYTGADYWAMSPGDFYDSDAGELYVYSRGALSNNWVISETGVRPVINLKSTVTLSSTNPNGCTSQNGTSSCPYIIDTN